MCVGHLMDVRLGFWIVTLLVIGLIAVPWLAPLFY
jgi:hypothetical protein